MSNFRTDVSPDRHSDYRRQAAQHFSAEPSSGDRWNRGRDMAAALLLLAALLLPWNVSFGVGVPDSSGWLFAVVTLATVLSWTAVALTHAGRRGRIGARFSSADAATRIRLALNLPYLLMVVGFLGFTVVQAVVDGGTGDVPPGIGPGVLVGVAGALLSAQPVIIGSLDDERFTSWLASPRRIGVVAMLLAVLAVLFNLYWRTRYVLPNVGDAQYGGQNIAVVATALVYGGIALIGVLVGLRWLLQKQRSARLATVGLGASALLASTVVWLTGVGRDIDAFHGIGQSTSTAAIGYEGYLAWAAAAAIVAPFTLYRVSSARPVDKGTWWEAAQKCLLLIAIWCAGSVVLRIFDLIVAASLDLPFSPYDSMALLAFDVVTGVVALWVRINLTNSSLHPAVISALCGVLFVLTVCRVVVGVGLAPRILYTEPPDGLDTAVYGNTLDHQITSTFDVVLCFLALAVAVTAVVVGQLGDLSTKKRRLAAARPVAAEVANTDAATESWSKPAAVTQPSTPQIARRHDADTEKWTRSQTDSTQRLSSTTEKLSVGPDAKHKLASPRIARSSDASTQQIRTDPPKIAQVLEESTQRFAAGTTYTGVGRRQPPADNDTPST